MGPSEFGRPSPRYDQIVETLVGIRQAHEQKRFQAIPGHSGLKAVQHLTRAGQRIQPFDKFERVASIVERVVTHSGASFDR
jgi:hypothetical protein